MRQIIPINRKWAFTMENSVVPTRIPAKPYWVNLPHTWNAIDGQDGGGDYYRGKCFYIKTFDAEELPDSEQLWLEIRGANSTANVYVDGKQLGHHDGGYSTWRVNVTGALHAGSVLAIAVDNSPDDRVYPQMADFTFYGGLYREVRLIGVPDAHFDLDYFGGPGLAVTPVVEGHDAWIRTEAWVAGAKEGQQVRFTLRDASGSIVASVEQPASSPSAEMVLHDVHLWHGRRDPYLYTAVAELLEGGEALDEVSVRFGCRSFRIDPEQGFFLNGEAYPLRGVSRHQDRWGIGNALLPEYHEEDMNLIMEVGATTIRLAHYQHDQYFYDLCDEKGLVVWAEIPYISQHMVEGRDNTLSQMRELIAQNYNHPSIVVWGLSNEITMKGAEDRDLIQNHRLLNDLAHEMDPTRLTAIAIVSMCPTDAAYIQIPDVVSWNHYFGWYGGDMEMNGPWFDEFHAQHPTIPVGVSEYGCEALNWHTSNPTQGDYTEEYQALYHESLIRQLFTRPYLWATHVWNMFDFGADNRAEGGENGQNHKGLVTFDRKYKKDSFYAYKAWLSDEPFVHICSKRYVDRVEDVTKVTVYSNLPEVELFANGKSLGRKESKEHFFYFDVPNAGETHLRAVADGCEDHSVIRKTEVFNEAYRLREKGAVLNWFDVAAPEGYYSLNDKLEDIMKSAQGKALLDNLMKSMSVQMQGGKAMSSELSPDMMKMMSGFTLLRLTSLMGAANVKFSKEQLLDLNGQLNRIPKV